MLSVRSTKRNHLFQKQLCFSPPTDYPHASFVCIRPGRITDDFAENCLLEGLKMCQHTCFLMRPLIFDFSKISKSGKKHQRCRCAWVRLTNFSKSRKTKRARRQSCQQLKRITPQIDGKVTKVRKSAKFHHSY